LKYLLFAGVHLALGVFFLLGVAYLKPERLVTRQKQFLAVSAVTLVLIWPLPALLGLARLIVYPARRLATHRLEDL
jgi:hypothetical protein